MSSKYRKPLSWTAIFILSLPALMLYAYSLRHPGVKGKSDALFLIEPMQAVTAKQGPWTMQESGTLAGLRGIDSVDGKIAWASGTGGTVLRTVDGGEHWAKCAVPDGDKDGATLDFRGVQAWDAQTAIVMASGPGEKSRLYETDDGGSSWKLLVTNEMKDGFWDAISWVPTEDRPQVLILGDPVDHRFVFDEFLLDGDSKTHSLTAKTAQDTLLAPKGAGAFAASNSSIAIGVPSRVVGIFGTGGTSGAAIYRAELPMTHSRGIVNGVRWRRIPVPLKGGLASSGVFSVGFGMGSHIVVAGGDYAKPNESAETSAWSTDGGLHWTAATKPPHGYRSSVAWSEDLKAWITVGTNGSDISRDDGKTWAPLDDPIMRDGNWNALSMPFVVGPKGRIARLTVTNSK